MGFEMAHRIVSHAFTTDLIPTEAASPNAVPTLVQLLPAPPFTGRDGRGPYSYDAQPLLDAFALNGKPLHIDYEHQSIGAGEKTNPTPAAGWINQLLWQDDGLWAEVEWTERAASHIASREYRYLSPVFTFNTKTGQITALRGAGLTNDPNLFLSSLNSREADRYTNGTLTQHEEEMLEKILEAMGLAAGADEDAVLAAVAALKTAADKAAAVAAEVGADADADAAAIVEAAQSRFTADTVAKDELVAMTQRAETAEAALAEANTKAETAASELQALKDAAHTKAIEDAVAGAISSGKFTPAQSEQLLKFARTDLDAFKAFVETAPVLAVAQHAQLPNEQQGGAQLTDAQRQMLAVAGIDEAKFIASRNKART